MVLPSFLSIGLHRIRHKLTMALQRAFAIALYVSGTSIFVNAQSFNPNGVSDPNSFNASHVGTNITTNATYSNPIMTINAGDP